MKVLLLSLFMLSSCSSLKKGTSPNKGIVKAIENEIETKNVNFKYAPLDHSNRGFYITIHPYSDSSSKIVLEETYILKYSEYSNESLNVGGSL